jgi:hypothetical protein
MIHWYISHATPDSKSARRTGGAPCHVKALQVTPCYPSCFSLLLLLASLSNLTKIRFSLSPALGMPETQCQIYILVRKNMSSCLQRPLIRIVPLRKNGTSSPTSAPIAKTPTLVRPSPQMALNATNEAAASALAQLLSKAPRLVVIFSPILRLCPSL